MEIETHWKQARRKRKFADGVRPVNDWWQCVSDRFAPLAAALLGMAVVILIGAVIFCAGVAAPTGEAAFFPCIAVFAGQLGIAVTLTLVALLLFLMAVCLIPAVAGVEGVAPGSTTGGLTEAIDCPTAQALLAAAERVLADAQNSLAAAEDALRAARRRLDAAYVAVGVALAMIGTVAFRPDLWLSAVAALVAAGALVIRRSRQVARAQANRDRAQEAVNGAREQVAVAQSLVDQLCGTSDSPPGPVETGDPGIGTVAIG